MRNILSGLVAAFPPTPGHPTMSTSLLYFHAKHFIETVSLPVDRLLEEVELTLPDSVSVTGISVFSDPERAWQVNLSKPRRASVYVDQYTGEIKGKYERPAFFVTMFRLHRWLLDSMKAKDVFGEIFSS